MALWSRKSRKRKSQPAVENSSNTNPQKQRKSFPAEAACHFDKSIAVFREIHAENVLALAYARYGRLHKEQGRIAEARQYLARALAIFERLGTMIEPEKVRKELAELPGRTDSTRPMV